MALVETLKACLMFLGIISLLIFIMIAAEVAFMILIQIVDEMRDRYKIKHRRRI